VTKGERHTGPASSNEEEYFARREAELMRQQRDLHLRERVEAERKSHFMKCPRCGYDLMSSEWHAVEIRQCPHCLGLWFDAGEAEKALAHPPGRFHDVFTTLMAGFRRAKAGDQ